VKLAVVLIFAAFWLVVGIVRAPEVPAASSMGVDEPWTMGLAAALQQGQVSGRDFNFTYGPLAQLLAALAIPLTSSRSAISAFPFILLLFWIASIVLFSTIVLLLDRVNWKHAFLIFLIATGLNLFSEPNSFRTLSLLLCAALLYRALGEPSPRKRLLGSVLTGFSALLAQLFTIEMGVYAVFLTTSLLLIFAGFASLRRCLIANEMHPPLDYFKILGCFLAAFVTGNFMISLAFHLSSPNGGFFDYQRFGIEIMRGYSLTMGSAWELTTLQTAALCLVGVYVIANIFAMARLSISQHSLPITLLACSLISLRTAFLRSDVGHITSALGPLIFLFIILAGYQLRNRWNTGLWFGCLVVLFATWPWSGLYAFSNLSDVVRGNVSLVQKITRMRAGPVNLSSVLPSGLAALDNAEPAPMLTFPYETHIAVALNRRIVAPSLQAYVANTKLLQEHFVAELEKWGKDLEVIYGIDGLGSGTIDGVQEVSRLPVIFSYLYRHFEAASEEIFDSGFAVMHRRTTPRELVFSNVLFNSVEESGRAIELRPHQTAKCSLVRISLAVEYPFLALLGRPSGFQLTFFDGNNPIQQTRMVALENGREFSTFVSLLSPGEFGRLLGNGETAVSQWDRLRLEYPEADRLDVRPRRVKATALGCFSRTKTSEIAL
jgi:hypothetical protein